MIEVGSIIVFTSLLSSLLTWVIAYVVFRTHLERRLDQQVTRLQAELEMRVKNGVRAAGVELLPELREQVKLGFMDAVNQSTAAGLVEDTARAVSTGVDFVESGLNALLGIGRSNKK